MAKSRKKADKQNKKMITMAACGVVAILLLCTTVATGLNLYWGNQTREEAQMITLRGFIESAVDRLGTAAPVDHRTGDIYFPEAKLYLPAPKQPVQLEYTFDANTGEFSISSDWVEKDQAAVLRRAQSYDQLFAAIPKFQSCSRGIKFTKSKIADDPTLENKLAITLGDGSKMYGYQELACPELSETSDILKGLKPY